LRTSWFADWARVPDPYVGRPLAALCEVNFILTSSVLVRRDLLAAVGGFDESMTHAEDVDLWIRLARSSPAAATARSLLRYQHRPGGLTRKTVARLEGNARLYERLARDRELDGDLRLLARRRAALSRLKLARAALKEGDGSSARRHLARGWGGGRSAAVAGAWLLSLLPSPMAAWVREREWIRRGVATPALQTRRVSLTSEPALMTDDLAAGRPRLGGGA